MSNNFPLPFSKDFRVRKAWFCIKTLFIFSKTQFHWVRNTKRQNTFIEDNTFSRFRWWVTKKKKHKPVLQGIFLNTGIKTCSPKHKCAEKKNTWPVIHNRGQETTRTYFSLALWLLIYSSNNKKKEEFD